MKAAVDQETCIGCGICPDVCPEVFEMRPDEKAHVKANPVPEGSEDAAEQAAGQCPVEAITIQD